MICKEVTFWFVRVSDLICGGNSQKFAKIRFKSYNSTVNMSIFKIRIFQINSCIVLPGNVVVVVVVVSGVELNE